MDLTQRKLTRSEWNNTEVPVSEEELENTTANNKGLP